LPSGFASRICPQDFGSRNRDALSSRVFGAGGSNFRKLFIKSVRLILEYPYVQIPSANIPLIAEFGGAQIWLKFEKNLKKIDFFQKCPKSAEKCQKV